MFLNSEFQVIQDGQHSPNLERMVQPLPQDDGEERHQVRILHKLLFKLFFLELMFNARTVFFQILKRFVIIQRTKQVLIGVQIVITK